MQEPTEYFIGIDGGGTHTRALLADALGHELGHGMAGPSNYQAVGISAARENISRSVAGAWEQSGIPRQPATAAFLGIAGVASEADRRTVTELARELELAGIIGADHDIRTALAGGLAGDEGMALIAGTGSACYGRRRDGCSWRAGGWGHLLDDAGGGYWMGVQAMAAMTRAHDGRTEPTSMVPMLLNILGITNMDDMLRLAGDSGLSRTEIAALAPLVLRAVEEGDHAAYIILEKGATELATMARAVANALGWTSTPVQIIPIGGLMADGRYAGMIRSAIAQMIPEARLRNPMLSPAAGAVLLAMELAGISWTPDIIAALRGRIPMN